MDIEQVLRKIVEKGYYHGEIEGDMFDDIVHALLNSEEVEIYEKGEIEHSFIHCSCHKCKSQKEHCSDLNNFKLRRTDGQR